MLVYFLFYDIHANDFVVLKEVGLSCSKCEVEWNI